MPKRHPPPSQQKTRANGPGSEARPGHHACVQTSSVAGVAGASAGYVHAAMYLHLRLLQVLCASPT